MTDLEAIARETAQKMTNIAKQAYPAPVQVIECRSCQGFGCDEDGSKCMRCAGLGRVATNGGEV